MKYCQGPNCHTYETQDRIRGPKGDKHYETRRRSNFYYMGGNVCSLRCQDDWFRKFGEQAINHFGRIHEPKRLVPEMRGARIMIGIITMAMVLKVIGALLID